MYQLRIATVMMFTLMLASACAGNKTPPGDQKMWSSLSAKELGRAVELAEGTVAAGDTSLANLKLTSAVNMMSGRDYRGPAYWRLTFKRRDLIPRDAVSILGAGGEIFVDVDLDANVAKIAGYGE